MKIITINNDSILNEKAPSVLTLRGPTLNRIGDGGKKPEAAKPPAEN